MKKINLKWKSICSGICLLIITVFILGIVSCNPKNQNTQNVTVTPCETELASVRAMSKDLTNQITGLLASNADLKADTARLGERVRCWESKFPNYRGSDCTGSVVRNTTARNPSVRKTSVRSTVRSTPVQSTQRVVTQSAPASQKTVIVQSTRRSTDNLSYLRDRDGKIIFCVRANGREDLYFPAFAIEHGVVFSDFQNNLQKGYNFDVEPSKEFTGDYGLHDDGIFYVSDALVRTSLLKESIALQYLDIKCPYTAWKTVRMTPEGDRWVFRTTPR